MMNESAGMKDLTAFQIEKKICTKLEGTQIGFVQSGNTENTDTR